MSIKLDSRSPTLADHNGSWCVWCLDYIPAGQEEQHHVYPTWSTDGRAGFATVLGDWTVPVHKKNEKNAFQCHRRGIQRHGDSIAYPIDRLTSSLSRNDLDRIAFNAWKTGHLRIGVAIREHLRKTCEEGDENAQNYLTVEVNSAAGAQLPTAMVEGLLTDGFGVGWDHKRPQCDPRRGLNAVALLTHYGGFQTALDICEAAERAIGKRASLNPVLARRKLPFSRNYLTAKDTVGLAMKNEDAYQKRTALLLSGWTMLGLEEYSKAFDEFLKVIESITTPPISWWHRFGAFFGLGCAEYFLEHGPTQSALGRLQAAQYVLCFLGLRGTAIPDFRQTSKPLNAALFPADVLEWIRQSHPGHTHLSPGTLFEIRQEWIGEEMQADLIRSQDSILRT